MDEPVDVARAWKDEEYRNSLTPEQLAKLPPNPAGEAELNEEDLEDISGGVIKLNSGWGCNLNNIARLKWSSL